MTTDETTPCIYCTTPTRMLGTKLCDPCWSLHAALTGTSAGVIATAIVASVAADKLPALRDALTAALDAPRLAARETAEIVAQDNENAIALLRTSAGEWAVGSLAFPWIGPGADEGVGAPFVDNANDPPEWHTGAGAELRARRLYATERGKVLCECGAEVDADDAVSDEGGGDLCPTCAAELRAEWLVGKVRCRNCDHTDAGRAFQGSPTDPDQCPRCGCEELEAVAPATLEISGEQVAAIDDGTAEDS